MSVNLDPTLTSTAPHPTVPTVPTTAVAKERIPGKPQFEKQPHEWGEVVVLVGTSTAGKTSIISELRERNPEMVERGVDLAFVNIPLNYLTANHSEDMAYLAGLIEPTEDDLRDPSYMLKYVDRLEEPNFKIGVSEEEKKTYKEVAKRLYDSLCVAIPGSTGDEYAHSIVTRMMDEIVLESKQGRPVACDILQINEVALNALQMQLPSVKVALVYVPFQTLAERVITRNNEAISERNFGNARPGVFPLEQFTKLFRPREAGDLDSEIVQKLTLGDVKHAIDAVAENSESFLRSCNPEPSDSLQQDLERLQEQTALLRTIILKNFGFKEDDPLDATVELTPSYKGYHMVINTSEKQRSKSDAVQDAVRQILSKYKPTK